MEELLSLKWNNHRSTFIQILSSLRDKQLYTDITLACDGKFYNAHKLVLSTCSDYFCAMLDKTASFRNPIIVLKDIKCEDLESLLDYMYLGEVNVRQCDLSSLIKSAECLKIKGLAVPDDPARKSAKNESIKKVIDSGRSPMSRRKRHLENDAESAEFSKTHSPSRSSSPPRKQLASEPISTNSVFSKESTPEKNEHYSSDNIIMVKEETDDDPLGLEGSRKDDAFDDSETFKDECSRGETGSEVNEYLQEIDSEALPGSSSQSSSFPAFHSGDLAGWQSDNSVGYPPFGTDGSSQQNTTGECGTGIGFSEEGVSCPVCKKNFKGPNQQYILNRHVQTIHSSFRPYLCPSCSYTSSRKDHLYRHIRVNHLAIQMLDPLE